MNKTKVKIKKIALGEQDEGLTEMFNQMIGAGDVNLHIAWPRYCKLKSLCVQLCNLFEQLELSPPLRRLDVQRAEIHKWVESTRAEISRIFTADLSGFEWNLSLVDEETHRNFSKIYDNMKKSDLINMFVVACDRIVNDKKYFSDPAKLDHKFIINMPGVEWKPFAFTTLDYKSIFITAEPSTISLFMIVLHKMFKFTLEIYNEIQTPDIDIDVFVDTIIKSIDNLKKIPELSRCGDAFKKLKESVALLKSKFNTYYQDFLSTKDSSIIMQHFVMDVGNTNQTSPRVARQFMTIVNYYRKMTDGQVTDKRLSMLLDKASKSFSASTRGTENMVAKPDESDTDSIMGVNYLTAPLSEQDIRDDN